jgi:hypothetical protein
VDFTISVLSNANADRAGKAILRTKMDLRIDMIKLLKDDCSSPRIGSESGDATAASLVLM